MIVKVPLNALDQAYNFGGKIYVPVEGGEGEVPAGLKKLVKPPAKSTKTAKTKESE